MANSFAEGRILAFLLVFRLRRRAGWLVSFVSTAQGTRSLPSGRRVTPIRTSRAATLFEEQLAGGYMGVAQLADGSLEQVKELPPGVELVMLRRPIAGG